MSSITLKNIHKAYGKDVIIPDLNFTIEDGSFTVLVGPSGCGKTTIGRAIVRLNTPTSGRILYDGQDILSLKGDDLRKIRRKLQIIFQDPYSSLNPRHTVQNMITEILTVQMGMTPAQAEDRMEELLDQVGLNKAYALRYPHEFSGGQKQRVAIAKAIALQPEFLVCDEAVSG